MLSDKHYPLLYILSRSIVFNMSNITQTCLLSFKQLVEPLRKCYKCSDTCSLGWIEKKPLISLTIFALSTFMGYCSCCVLSYLLLSHSS